MLYSNPEQYDRALRMAVTGPVYVMFDGNLQAMLFSRGSKFFQVGWLL